MNWGGAINASTLMIRKMIMSEIDLAAVLSPYIVARVSEVPRDIHLILDQEVWVGTWMKEDDTLILESPDCATERQKLMDTIQEFPCVSKVSLWAGGETRYVEVLDDVLCWDGNTVEFYRGHGWFESLLAESEELVAEMEG